MAERARVLSARTTALVASATGLALLAGLAMPSAPALPFAPASAHVAAAPLAQATPTPEITTLRGVLQNGGIGCPPAGLHVVLCDGSGNVAVYNTPGVIDVLPLLGQEVEITGVMRPCQAGMGDYIDLQSISPRPCGDANPTPPPAAPRNLAMGAEVIASADGVPGYPPTALTDGDAATEWRVPPGRAAWAYIDLGREEVFSRMVLRWGQQFATEYSIYVWDDMLGAEGDWLRLAYRPDGRGANESLAIPRAEGRFLLLHLVKPDMPGGGFALAEWEVFGEKTPNLALGCVARAVGSQKGREPWRAIDADPSSSWASTPGANNPHLVVTCDQPVQLNEIRIHWDEDLFGSLYRVAFYRAGGILPRGFGIENNDGGRDKISWVDPVEADGVVIYVDEITDGFDHVAIYELELFSLGAGDDAALAASAEPMVDVLRTSSYGSSSDHAGARPLVSGGTLDWWSMDGYSEGVARSLVPGDLRIGPLPGEAQSR